MKTLTGRGIDKRLCDLLLNLNILQNVQYVFGALKNYTPAPDPIHSMEPGHTNYVWYVTMTDNTKWNIILFQYDFDTEYEYTCRAWKESDPELPEPTVEEKDRKYLDYFVGFILGYSYTKEELVSVLPISVAAFDTWYNSFLQCVIDGNREAAVEAFNAAADCINRTSRSYENLPLLEERYAYMKQKLDELSQR